MGGRSCITSKSPSFWPNIRSPCGARRRNAVFAISSPRRCQALQYCPFQNTGRSVFLSCQHVQKPRSLGGTACLCPPILLSWRSQPSVHPALYHHIYAICQVTFKHEVCELNPRKAVRFSLERSILIKFQQQ